jgi:eukaryotic-like serine/threonine-protein kinase
MQPGSRLGPYEIVSRIGAGGMGEVWRARDTRLGREVAIKILPAEFAQDAKLKIRFEREAQTISHLAHPNICTLFDVGENYLVMELLEGESLADRLTRGPLPLKDVVRVGVQIAEALGKAHREGVVHRDLKPGNIMLTKSGAKLLDFGLAKSTTVAPSPVDQTVQKPLTEQGTVVGTFRYMAPEQLAGEEPDPRTDIFALGAVLYEMTTGKRAFEGKNRASLIAAIVGGEPRAMSELQPLTPPMLEHVILKCLEKDPDDRWQSASDIAGELRWIGQAGPQASVAPVVIGRRTWRDRLMVAAITVLISSVALLAAGALLMPRWGERSSPPRRALLVESNRFAPFAPGMLELNQPILSPDGTRLAYVAIGPGGRPGVAVRDLRTGDDTLLEGTEEAALPFWSPDGRNLGFISGSTTLRVTAESGTSQRVCEVSWSVRASWGRDGTILFSHQRDPVILRVSASGGTPVPATALGPQETGHFRPLFVSDDAFLLAVATEEGAAKSREGLYFARLGRADKTFLLPIQNLGVEKPAVDGYTVSGDSLILLKGRELAIYPFDRHRGEIVGPARTIELPGMASSISASERGNVVFREAAPGRGKRRLQWFDRNGRVVGRIGEDGAWGEPEISPDGSKVAVAFSTDEREAIIVFDLARGAQMGTTGEGSFFPVWSDDGASIAVSQMKLGPLRHFDVLLARADGVGGSQPILTSSDNEIGWDIDRGRLLFSTDERSGGLWTMDLAGSERRQIPAAAEWIRRARFSPDGDWVLYDSPQSGRGEIYLQRVDGTGSRVQVSADGGEDGRWRKDGGEIYFLDPLNRMVAVEVNLRDGSYHIGTAAPLFEAPLDRYNTSYDVNHDGTRFLIRTRAEAGSIRIWYLTDWLRR